MSRLTAAVSRNARCRRISIAQTVRRGRVDRTEKLPWLGSPAGLSPCAGAQRARVGPAVKPFVRIDTNVVVLQHVRVIDGRAAPAREDQTVVIRDGMIAAVGAAASVAVPSGAQVLDLDRKSVV